MNTAALADLGNFTGTQSYTKLRPFTLLLTDGTLFLATNADCFWLFNEIAAAQNLPTIKNDQMLQGMQFWELTPHGRGAMLTCYRDEGDKAWHKHIEFTDFPFDSFPEKKAKIWVALTEDQDENLVPVAYLPSEH